ncbi:hypothetical protein Q5P01_017833 [Channa striata]|uniref:Uncharacterized protein n=1 Tax=Channa striata TaxID=64152 RepID=A0AA88SC16_CHASR|nr:hypothetical protein Q5P01_017833 [Channa striata]
MKPQHRVFYCVTKTDVKYLMRNISPAPTAKSLELHDESWTEGRNPIIIRPPRRAKSQCPVSVVTLALSLVLLMSRFTATVHLAACLGDRSAGQRFDKNYLQQQYTYTEDM